MLTSLYEDGKEYYGTHWWYDPEDNEFCLNVVWKFERGGDIPDSWHLQSVELEDYSQSLPQGFIEEVKWMCGTDREIWRYVEREGPAFQMEEVIDK